MANVYPTINLPTLVAPRSQRNPKLDKIAPSFNFEFGEFEFTLDGRPKMATPQETFEQWCVKVCFTERVTKAAYTYRYGVELEEIATISDIAVARSQIVKTISEAIMAHPITEWVKNFHIKIKGDCVWVAFDVKGKNFDDATRIEAIL